MASSRSARHGCPLKEIGPLRDLCTLSTVMPGLVPGIHANTDGDELS